MSVKQILVVRKDLNMRKGKIAVQCCHASMKIFFERMGYFRDNQFCNKDGKPDERYRYFQGEIKMTPEMYEWFRGTFTKICVSVDSEQDLIAAYDRAKMMNLPCALIEDNGLTEFNGVVTKTCCAIGPANADEIDKITGGLKLL